MMLMLLAQGFCVDKHNIPGMRTGRGWGREHINRGIQNLLKVNPTFNIIFTLPNKWHIIQNIYYRRPGIILLGLCLQQQQRHMQVKSYVCAVVYVIYIIER
jgi:hypothetical protein